MILPNLTDIVRQPLTTIKDAVLDLLEEPRPKSSATDVPRPSAEGSRGPLEVDAKAKEPAPASQEDLHTREAASEGGGEVEENEGTANGEGVPKRENQAVTFVVGHRDHKKPLRRILADRKLDFLPIDLTEEAFVHQWASKICPERGDRLILATDAPPSFVLDFAARAEVQTEYLVTSFAPWLFEGSKRPVWALALDAGHPLRSTSPSELLNHLASDELRRDEALLDRAARGLERLVDRLRREANLESVRIGRGHAIKRVLVLGSESIDPKWTDTRLTELARRENPGAEVVLRPDPACALPADPAVQGRLVAPELPIARALADVDRVYTAGSPEALVAIALGIETTTVGEPFYAGWGLTEDRSSDVRRSRTLSPVEFFAAVYFHYITFYEAETGREISFEDAFALLPELPEVEAFVQTIRIEAQLERAKTLMSAFKYDEAEVELRSLIASHPERAGFWARLGSIQSTKRDFESAVQSYTRACELDATEARYFSARARARAKAGQLTDAITTDMRRSIELTRGEDFDLLSTYFDYEWERRRITDALLAEYDVVAKRYIQDPSARSSSLLMRYASMLLEVGRVESAARMYQKALKKGESAAGFVRLRLTFEPPPAPKSKPTSRSLPVAVRKAYEYVEAHQHAFRDLIHRAHGDVAIVGNGPQELGRGRGPEIDSRSVVVRFNSFDTRYPLSEDYGTKTDVWVRMPPCGYVHAMPPERLDLILVSGSNKLHRSFRDWEWVASMVRQGYPVQLLPADIFYDLVAELNAAPTSGLCLAYMLYREIGPLREDHVYGASFAYDGAADERGYHCSDPQAAASSRHAFDREAAFFKKISRRERRTYYTPLAVRQTDTTLRDDHAQVPAKSTEALDWSISNLEGAYDLILSASPGLAGYALYGRGVQVVPRAEIDKALAASAPALQDAAQFPTLAKSAASKRTLVLGFGLGPTGERGKRLSQLIGCDYQSVEFGLISSLHLPSEKQFNFSLFLDDLGVFYDTTRPSRIEQVLFEGIRDDREATLARARVFLDKVVAHDITKYNNADEIILPKKTKGKRRILVVDQTAGDLSLTFGQCATYSFDDMLAHALAQPDAEVIVKLHPEAVAGAKGANYDRATLRANARVQVIDRACNIMSLIKQSDEVYVMTSGVGLEALMAGTKVRCFGVPFYAGWGLTEDMVPVKNPRRTLTIEELVAGVFLRCHQFYDPTTHAPCTPEACLDALIPLAERDGRILSIGGRLVRYSVNDKHERHYIDSERAGHITIDGSIAARFIRPGDVVVDAGANIGYTALKYAQAGAARVYAFEPVSRLFRRLEAIQDEVIRPMHMALGDQDMTAEILLSTGHAQGNSLSPEMVDLFPDVFAGDAVKESVTVRRLDGVFDEERLDFLKIDVEGFEMELLRGATGTLDRLPPRALQIELYEHQVAPVREVLRRWFPFEWRAVIEKSTKQLRLLPIDEEPATERYRGIRPPVYLFTREDPRAAGEK